MPKPITPQSLREEFSKFMLGDFANGLHVPRTPEERNNFLDQAFTRIVEQTRRDCIEIVRKQALQDVEMTSHSAFGPVQGKGAETNLFKSAFNAGIEACEEALQAVK